MSIQGSVLAWRSAVATLVVAGAQSVPAAAHADDSHALNTIFGDEHLATNVLEVCSRATESPLEDRYGFLADWVLPGDDHATFRVVAAFSPTYPPPTSGDDLNVDRSRIAAGGEIVSPVLDLIDAAARLGRLEQLRKLVETASPDSVRTEIDRLTLLALVDVARNDLTSAQSLLVEVFGIVLPDENATLTQSDASLLCVHAAAAHPILSRSIVDSAFRILTSYQSVEEWTTWQRQFAAAYARAKQTAGIDGDDSTIDEVAPLTRWFPASLPSARYRGTGCPVAWWSMAPGRAVNLASHDDDFLYFAVPLRGNFEMEWDITAFDWRTSELIVAGQWVAARYDLESYRFGGIQDIGTRGSIAPRLTRVDDHIHYRSVVRDGMVSTFVNGRPIHAQPVGRDPWLAVRSTARQNGAIRNLKLSGDPVVPEELNLADDVNLAGWIPYHEELIGLNWQSRNGLDGSAVIYGRRQQELPHGCCRERALFYHRPMLEDGSIEYEFWFDGGRFEAHPVLDRLCFMIDAEGVRVHWLTDGLFDRTSRSPANLYDEPDNQPGPTPLPLAEGDWNRLRLTLRGGTVELQLNGEVIYLRDVEPTNQRNFGLFHYADQTELRVRNVTWTGDWARELPEIDAQELAFDESGFLDARLPELKAVFTHDFATDGLPLERFTIFQGEVPKHVAIGPDGLGMTREGLGDGYIAANLGVNVGVRGDFDITAAFDRFAADTKPDDGSCSIFLWVQTDDDHACRVLRRRVFRSRDQQIIQCSRNWSGNDETRRRFFGHLSMEATAGTMRLARRGETVYYLFAENDSRQFRLIGQEEFPADDLPLRGVRLILQTHGDGDSTSVVWKDITVRAEELSGPAVDGPADLLLNLNREQ